MVRTHKHAAAASHALRAIHTAFISRRAHTHALNWTIQLCARFTLTPVHSMYCARFCMTGWVRAIICCGSCSLGRGLGPSGYSLSHDMDLSSVCSWPTVRKQIIQWDWCVQQIVKGQLFNLFLNIFCWIILFILFILFIFLIFFLAWRESHWYLVIFQFVFLSLSAQLSRPQFWFLRFARRWESSHPLSPFLLRSSSSSSAYHIRCVRECVRMDCARRACVLDVSGRHTHHASAAACSEPRLQHGDSPCVLIVAYVCFFCSLQHWVSRLDRQQASEWSGHVSQRLYSRCDLVSHRSGSGAEPRRICVASSHLYDDN